MEILVLQAICLLVLFISMTVSSSIPVLLVCRRNNIHLSDSVISWISFGNCVAGGVFLGMCFLGLFPYVHQKFADVLTNANINKSFPLSEFVIIIGFFIIFFVEHLVLQTQSSMENSGKSGEVHMSRINSKQGLDDDESYVRLLESSSQEQDLCEDIKVTVAKPLPITHNFHHTSSINMHSHCDPTLAVSKSTGLRRIILLIALSIHSLFEGMMLGLQTDQVKLFDLFIAVLIHELLVALALGVNFAKLNLGLLNSLKYILLVTGSIPLGIVVGVLVKTTPGLAGAAVSAVLQGIAAGIFIHVIFMEIIPEELANGKSRLLKIMFFFIGFLIMAFLNFILGSH